MPRLLHDYPCFGTPGYWAAQEGSEHGEVEYELTRTIWENHQ
ncbi:hypothetical protein KPP03845_100043 [Streptomyces xanthophaeus]|nr:hypothetical protein [Streptomyces xanthophaeus]WCD83724.1 hypothetical protein KPP03845_100043 [Streptomyces xanthophaeus]